MVVCTLSRTSIILSWGRGVGHGTIATDSFCYHGDLVHFMNKCLYYPFYMLYNLKTMSKGFSFLKIIFICFNCFVGESIHKSTHKVILEGTAFYLYY